MPSSLSILRDNAGFLTQVYGSGFQPLIVIMMVLAVFDLSMKGWALWRAARMHRLGWFLSLLLVNSAGILPILFLLMTNAAYSRLEKETSHSTTVLH